MFIADCENFHVTELSESEALIINGLHDSYVQFWCSRCDQLTYKLVDAPVVQWLKRSEMCGEMDMDTFIDCGLRNIGVITSL